MAKNLCNMWLKICEICVLSFQPLTSTKVYVRKNKLFLQNEPKFQKVKFNVTEVLTKDYVQMDTWSIGKNEPKTNPKRTQNEPNTNPKRTQYEPKQSQFQSTKNAIFKNFYQHLSVQVRLSVYMDIIFSEFINFEMEVRIIFYISQPTVAKHNSITIQAFRSLIDDKF
jgi:hypothetical protein